MKTVRERVAKIRNLLTPIQEMTELYRVDISHQSDCTTALQGILKELDRLVAEEAGPMRTKPMSKPPDHLLAHLEQLVGGTVLGVAATSMDPLDRDRCSALIIEKDGEKKTCWIMCDPEGNGPGWLDIEDE